MIRTIKRHLSNIQIVRFSDDTYGIRKGWVFYRYLSDKNSVSWNVKDRAYSTIKFDNISKLFEKFFYDDGIVVGYERFREDEQPCDTLGNAIHIEPDKYKQGLECTIIEYCKSCTSVGVYSEMGYNSFKCDLCENENEYPHGPIKEKMAGKWCKSTKSWKVLK